MDQPLSLRLSDLHLLGYEDNQHGTFQFGQNQPFVPHSAISNITPLPTSCPQAESISQRTQMHRELPISDHVFLENRSCENQNKQTNPSHSKTQKPKKRQRQEPKPAPSPAKKRGEVRDAEIPLSGAPEDVRWILLNLCRPSMCINPTTDSCNSAVARRFV